MLTDCDLSETAFEDAVAKLEMLAGKAVSVVMLVVPPQEQFCAAMLVRHYEDIFRSRAFLAADYTGMVPRHIEVAVHLPMNRGSWLVMHGDCVVWSPGA